eukprot:scaffold9729_cov108-Isochrysis_galbana.AAC.5
MSEHLPMSSLKTDPPSASIAAEATRWSASARASRSIQQASCSIASSPALPCGVGRASHGDIPGVWHPNAPASLPAPSHSAAPTSTSPPPPPSSSTRVPPNLGGASGESGEDAAEETGDASKRELLARTAPPPPPPPRIASASADTKRSTAKARNSQLSDAKSAGTCAGKSASDAPARPALHTSALRASVPSPRGGGAGTVGVCAPATDAAMSMPRSLAASASASASRLWSIGGWREALRLERRDSNPSIAAAAELQFGTGVSLPPQAAHRSHPVSPPAWDAAPPSSHSAARRPARALRVRADGLCRAVAATPSATLAASSAAARGSACSSAPSVCPCANRAAAPALASCAPACSTGESHRCAWALPACAPTTSGGLLGTAKLREAGPALVLQEALPEHFLRISLGHVSWSGSTAASAARAPPARRNNSRTLTSGAAACPSGSR